MREFGKFCRFRGQLDVSALYALAQPSTPEHVRDAAIDRAAAGERVTHASVKHWLAETSRKIDAAFAPPVWTNPGDDVGGGDETDKTGNGAATPPGYDPEARRRFEIEADLGGSFKLFTAARWTRPRSRAIHPAAHYRRPPGVRVGVGTSPRHCSTLGHRSSSTRPGGGSAAGSAGHHPGRAPKALVMH